MNYKQIYAIKKANEERILKLCPNIPQRSGIYIFYREEIGFKYAYVGQAVDLLKRTAEHLKISDNHIDRSLKVHGLYNENNLTGYKLWFKEFPKIELDEKEQEYERKIANLGYQLLNKTIGGQGVGKNNLDVGKSTKGYRDGIAQGRKNLIKELKGMLKYLKVTVKTENRALKLEKRMLDKFNDVFKEREQG